MLQKVVGNQQPTSSVVLINGNATKDLKIVTAGAKVSKSSAYASLAAYVKNKTGSTWTADNAKSRLAAWMKLYKETSRDYENTGGAKYCLNEVDLKNGLTLEDKLEEDCPFYRRMETLFGGRQNVMPSHVWQSSQLQQTQYAYSQMGQPPTFDFSSDSDKDDDHDDDHDEEDKLKQNDSNATTNTTTTTATASTFNPNVSCLNSLVSSNAISQSTSVTIDKISQLPGQTTTNTKETDC